MMSSPASKLTYADLQRLPQDRLRHELIDGKHIVSPAPQIRHQRVLRRLAYRIEHYLLEQPAGELFQAPTDVVLSPHDVVEPDLLFVAAARAAIVGEANIAGAPDLVVEVLSPSTRQVDETDKLRLYERFGVMEYWLIDPSSETVRVYRLERGAYRLALRLSASESGNLSSPLLPGLRIRVADLFRD